jgi:hypothetical protein
LGTAEICAAFSGGDCIVVSKSNRILAALVCGAILALLVEIVWAQTHFTEYANNPILGQGVSGGPKAYYPSVLYDSASFAGHDGGYTSTYKMWFDSDSTTKLATSDDGITWTIRADVSLANVHHPLVKYYAAGFAGANSGNNPSGSTMYYRMWYWTGTMYYTVADLRYAESNDGITWYNDQPLQNGAVPIVTGTWPDWNRGSYGPCDVLYNPSASNSGTDWTFTLYYDGTTGGTESIGLAFSSDGITWTGYDGTGDGKADAVLTGTFNAGDWDYNYVSRATVIKYANGSYEMWYSGGNNAMHDGIGFATSTDGITWTRRARIFYKTDGVTWRANRTYCPMVIRQFGIYKMWYAGRSASGQYAIGYAVDDGATAVTLSSFDARSATPSDSNPLVLVSGMGVLGIGILLARRWQHTN